jgi:hypothetical protein
MADFNINLKYKGAGGKGQKGAAGGLDKDMKIAREKAIQASKKSSEGGSTSSDFSKRLIESNYKLNASIVKLIKSNETLKSAIGNMNKNLPVTGGGGGEAPQRTENNGKKAFWGGFAGGAVGGAISRMPGSVGDVFSFAVSKIHQIGTAYMEETGKQRGTVGTGGFRGGQRGYMGEELGAGMKAYGLTTRNWANKEKIGNFKTAMDLGNIFGQTPEETFKQKGVFDLTGRKGLYEKTANIAAGTGVKTEIPLLISSVADELEEAVKNGVNASDMADKMGGQLATITSMSVGKSVEGAMRTVKAWSSTKEAGAHGKVTSLTGLMGYKGAQESFYEKMNMPSMNEEYIKGLKLNPQQTQKLIELKRKGVDINSKNFQEISGGTESFFTSRELGETGSTQYLRNVARGYKRSFKGMSHEQMWGLDPESGLTPQQWKVAMEVGELSDKEFNAMENEKKGKKIISTKRQKNYAETGAAMGTELSIQKANMVFQYGAQFATTTVKMEQTMMKFAEAAIGPAQIGLKGLNGASITLIETFGRLSEILNSNDSAWGKFKKVAIPSGWKEAIEEKNKSKYNKK